MDDYDYSDEEIYLSDEDLFENDDNESKSFVTEMQKGTLPHEVRFLYACCLVGEDKNEFAAMKLFSSIEFIEEENVDSLSKSMLDLSISPDESWYIFRHKVDAQLQKGGAINFIHKILRSLPDDKQTKWFIKLGPMIISYYDTLFSKKDIQVFRENRMKGCIANQFYHDFLISNVYAYCDSVLFFVENDGVCSRAMLPSSLRESLPCNIGKVLDAINVNRRVLWSNINDGALHGKSIEVNY